MRNLFILIGSFFLFYSCNEKVASNPIAQGPSDAQSPTTDPVLNPTPDPVPTPEPTPDPTPDPSPTPIADNLGTVVHVPSSKLLTLAEQLNLKWLRISNFWNMHPQACGSFQFSSQLDQSVSSARARGFSIFMTIGDGTHPCASRGDRLGDGPSNDVPKNANLYYTFAYESAKRYRPMGVRHYGLWNEPNLEHFFEATPQETIDLIYVPGFQGVKDGCRDAGFSDCLILGPETTYASGYDDYLEALLVGMNAKNLRFDILTHHIYKDHDAPSYKNNFINALEYRKYSWDKRGLVEVLEDAGWAKNGVPDMEVWITETGHRSKPATSQSEWDYQSKDALKTIEEQLKRNWWSNTFFYQLKDAVDILDGFGWARGTGAPHFEDNFVLKPVFTNVRDLVNTNPALQGTRLK